MPPPDSNDEIDAGFRNLVNARLDDGSLKMKRMEEALQANTEATERVEKNTQEIVDFFNTLKSSVKVLNVVAALAKPITAILLCGTAVWGVVSQLLKRGA